MKYIHIVQVLLANGGGVGSVVTDLCQEMAQSSSNVEIISLQYWPEVDLRAQTKWAEEYGIHVETVQKPEKSKWAGLYYLRKYLKKLSRNEDCCLYMHLKWGVLGGILCSLGLKHIRRIEVYHSGYQRYKLQAFLSRPFIDHYIAVSEEAKKQLIEQFRISEDKIEVVYNGINIEYTNTKSHQKRLDKNCDFTFMSVGRLSFEKGFQNSIEAYSNARNSGWLVNSRYLMIGDGNMRADCEKLAGGSVCFTGMIPRDDVYPYIASSDIMVLPSWWEGNSILLLEVLALGKPMIVSDIPSFREVLNFTPLAEEENFRVESFGVVFRKKDVKSCIEGMKWAYSNQAEIQAMGENVRKLADNFSVHIQSQKYFKAAQKLF